MSELYSVVTSDQSLSHHGVLGMHWGVRRYQNKDGSLTNAGRKRIRRPSKWYHDQVAEMNKGTDKGNMHKSYKNYTLLKENPLKVGGSTIKQGVKDRVDLIAGLSAAALKKENAKQRIKVGKEAISKYNTAQVKDMHLFGYTTEPRYLKREIIDRKNEEKDYKRKKAKLKNKNYKLKRKMRRQKKAWKAVLK